MPRSHVILVGAALAALTLAAFWPVTGNGFINFDDPAYITANAQVRQGLTLHGVIWAFTTFHAACWHPLTWLSHMLDVQLFGLRPGPHHLHSLALHLLAAVLLYAGLTRMTGRVWASAAAAALFAVHPLRVESVAWAAERKDVLGAFWWMLTLWLYVGRIQQPDRRGGMRGVTLAFTVGLMAKPMLITLPFALLLLDMWPLARCSDLAPRQIRPLLREKAPLFALSLASGVITLIAEHAGAAVVDWHSLSWPERLINAALAYVRYLSKFFWPRDLAVLYPLTPHQLSWEQGAGAGLLLLVLTGAALGVGRRAPYLLVGWLWFLGVLMPVIGIVQIGNHALADRFSYLPSVGLSLAVTWSLLSLGRRLPRTGHLLAAVSLAALLGLAWRTRVQTQYWRSSISLYTHTLAVTRSNYVILTNMGIAQARQGRLHAALGYLDRAVRANPDFAEAHDNRGNVLAAMGRMDEAVGEYRSAVRLAPDNARAQHNLGLALMRQHRFALALPHLQRAVDLAPGLAGARNDLAVALISVGRYRAARNQLRQVVRTAPWNQRARANLQLLEKRLRDGMP